MPEDDRAARSLLACPRYKATHGQGYTLYTRESPRGPVRPRFVVINSMPNDGLQVKFSANFCLKQTVLVSAVLTLRASIELKVNASLTDLQRCADKSIGMLYHCYEGEDRHKESYEGHWPDFSDSE